MEIINKHPIEQAGHPIPRMDISIFFFLLFLLQTPPNSSATFQVLEEGSSLSVDNSNDYLISANGVYSAGFFNVGDNAFCFAVWFINSSPPVAAWMANRDKPVNGKGSKLALLGNGDLFLTDAGGIPIWNSKTNSTSPVNLVLLDTGNLVLRNSETVTLWQSFDSPTDTLLPEQPLTKDTQLVSSRSEGNFSSGFYKLYFDNDNVLRLLYNGPEISSVYWPEPWRITREAGRTTSNNSRIAIFNNLGSFESSDEFSFKAADSGMGRQRRLKLDFDGNVRMYTLKEATGTWSVSWQAISQQCMIHGICGPNSLCSYSPESGRICSCLPGFKIKNPTDWSHGCQPESQIYCNHTEVGFLRLSHVDFYGYDIRYIPNSTYEDCKDECLQSCDCKAFMLLFRNGVYNCYPKFLMVNGHRSQSFDGVTYVKRPKARISISNNDTSKKIFLICPRVRLTELETMYKRPKENESLRLLIWFACGVGGVEIACIILLWYFLRGGDGDLNAPIQGYIIAATGFRKFSYIELKKATLNFSEEIGRGAAGTVYKGTLSDGRVAAIKRLNEANQGEAEFLAEVSTIGKLNHMNLIEMWGYCAEGKHRLLVYELVKWVRAKMNATSAGESWIEEIVDPLLGCDYNAKKLERLVRVALNCLEEDKDARPTMSQVVEMLVRSEDE
ncbi:hypothetical protein Patl1_08883 [Pistacia atlantica]|uniref:Uncharacterized protein n=1 Tax=Pistacia atlantica TaxID=434234 RepID=A0ACC1AE14_9ROSI|nr:hypothetical protein Patl1_08883 [Pistacia atlantica]